ncbi:MAG: 4Fe-4S binding protein, partial [Bacteroidota bacterium]|nr:4Fe-4S binding protein [Bacteroidota bacterium]
MKLAFLKKVRVVIAILFFASTLFLFVDFAGLITIRFLKSILYLQFVPSLLSFISLLSLASAGFIFILLLTLLSGRVYCSAVCPLGIFQDIISRIARRFKRKKHFRYRKPLSWVWYSILFLTVVFAILLNNLLPVNLLDPYSLFGKMSTAIFRPAVYGMNNLVNHILNKIHIFYLYPVPITRVSVVSEIFAGAFMLFLIAMAAWKGRWYCNTICPVGSLLG